MPASNNPPSRTTLLIASVVLVAVALLGYFAGRGHPLAAPVESTRSASIVSGELNYPSGWQPASRAPGIPGLAIVHPVVVAPGGNAARAGLVTGQLARGGPNPLPTEFLARLGKPPGAAVVNLLGTQAYEYSQLNVPGFNRMLTLYAIPHRMGATTAMACYASKSFSTYMGSCEQVVALLTLQAATQSDVLTPDPNYARRLSAAIARVDELRAQLRPGMRSPAPFATVQNHAMRLAAGLDNAAVSFAALRPPAAAAQVNARLLASLEGERDAYLGLAVAAAANSPSRYAAELTLVYRAEANVNGALRSFALFGYQQT
jgi:hypothetical protein